MKGWVCKQGHNWQNWKRRYAVYDPATNGLSYYEDPSQEGQEPKGRVTVKSYDTQQMNVGMMCSVKQFGFVIQGDTTNPGGQSASAKDKNELRMYVETQQEFEQWRKAFNASSKGATIATLGKTLFMSTMAPSNALTALPDRWVSEAMFFLRSAKTGHYVACEETALVCRDRHPTIQFYVSQDSTGKVSLKSSDRGLIVNSTQGGRLVCDAWSRRMNKGTQFDLYCHGDGTVSLRSCFGYFISVDSSRGDEGEMRCDSTEVGAAERFSLKNSESVFVTLSPRGSGGMHEWCTVDWDPLAPKVRASQDGTKKKAQRKVKKGRAQLLREREKQKKKRQQQSSESFDTEADAGETEGGSRSGRSSTSGGCREANGKNNASSRSNNRGSSTAGTCTATTTATATTDDDDGDGDDNDNGDWVPAVSETGEAYYYHRHTRSTRWVNGSTCSQCRQVL
jgi:hypothetical protein